MTLEEEFDFYAGNLRALYEATETVTPFDDDPDVIRLDQRILVLYIKNLRAFAPVARRFFARKRPAILGDTRRFPIEHRFKILKAIAEESRHKLERMKPKRGKKYREFERSVLDTEKEARDAARTLKARAKEVGAWNAEYAKWAGLVPPWIEEE